MLANIIELVVVLIVFVLILIATYFTTRWIGKGGGGVISPSSKNIQVIETYKISQTKYVQLVRVGSKYVAIGVGKDSITKLVELTDDELDLSVDESVSGSTSFKDFYDKLIHRDKEHKNN